MKPSFFLVLLLWIGQAFTFSISIQDAQKIGDKIWRNECGGTVDGLTHWNTNENFPSLGIGHFIWYPKDKRDRFHETFPLLLTFLQKEGVQLPNWLKKADGCPWGSREQFYEQIQSPEMQGLRQMLFETRKQQAIFIAIRLEKAFPHMIQSLSKQEKSRLTDTFHRLAGDARGLYALLDYLNFKGDGTSSAETYKGQGWGLLQVLQRVPSNSKNPVADFVEAAKIVLLQRIQNSPPERNEKRWLQGWSERVNSYLN
jgi:hypothetical protein